MIAVARQSRLQLRQPHRFILTPVGETLYRSEAGSYFAVVTATLAFENQTIKGVGRDKTGSLRCGERLIQRIGSAVGSNSGTGIQLAPGDFISETDRRAEATAAHHRIVRFPPHTRCPAV